VPSDDRKDESPDRIDALVHALAGEVTLIKKKSTAGGVVRTSNPGKNRTLGLRRSA
jgi:hypothetical protein